MTTRLDLYLGFKNDFFHTERWDVTDEERVAEISKTSSDYRSLLLKFDTSVSSCGIATDCYFSTE